MSIVPVIDVHQNNGILVTTSRNVAEIFEKEHRNVLRDIKTILDTNKDIKFTQLNFELSEYTDPTGRKLPEYLLTRDGTMLLIMGYSGEKAMTLKTEYIKAFNEMEAVLKEQQSKTKAVEYTLKDKLESTTLILQIAGIAGNQLALALDKQYKKETGYSAIKATNTALEAPIQEHLATPTQIGKQLGIGPVKVNKLLEEYGYQEKNEKGEWTPTKIGLEVGGTLLDVNKAHSDGTPVRQLKWPYSVVDILRSIL